MAKCAFYGELRALASITTLYAETREIDLGKKRIIEQTINSLAVLTFVSLLLVLDLLLGHLPKRKFAFAREMVRRKFRDRFTAKTYVYVEV